MFITWMKTIGGRLESRLRFSGGFTYNTFPLPEVPAPLRRRIVEAGQTVLDARAAHDGSSLIDLYRPKEMPANLIEAHDALDDVVDAAFGGKQRYEHETERQKVLFRWYAKLTGQETLG